MLLFFFFSFSFTSQKTSSLTSGDPNLEDIDFDKFYDMELSEEDEARELAFLLAQIPPPRVAHTFSTHSKNSRFQTSPSSPTLAQQSPGLVPLSPTPARRRFQTPLSSPAPARHRFQTPLSSPTPAQSSSSLVTLSPIQARQLVPSTRSPVVKTLRSPVSPCSMLSDEAAFWVVMSGAYPGVYHGRYVISFFSFTFC